MKRATQLIAAVCISLGLYVSCLVATAFYTTPGLWIFLAFVYLVLFTVIGAGIYLILLWLGELQAEDERDEEERLRKLKRDYDHYFGGDK